MSSCSDDAALTGPVALFTGIETSTWNIQQFVDAANWAKQHNVSTLFIKVFEVGSSKGDSFGVWYGGINSWDVIYQEVQKIVNVVPYGFLYGDTFGTLDTEIFTAKQFLQKYGKLCLDMEGKYWNNTNSASWATKIASALQPIPGKLWLSCPANPSQAGDMPFIQAMSPAVNIYMPMVYDTYLNTTWEQAFNVSSQCVQPTIDLSQEFGPNDVATIVASMKQAGVLALSCWYYGFAQSNPGLLDQIVSEFAGTQPTTGGSVLLDQNGCVMTVPKTFQLETEQLTNVPNSPQGKHESDDLCGPWAPVAASRSVPPGQTPKASQEEIDRFTDDMVDYIWKGTGFNHQNFLGVLPNDMIKILDYIRDNTNKSIHYQVIAGNDVPRAVQAGYLCLFSCSETNITAWDKTKKAWVHAYPWSLSAGHVLTCGGIEKGTGNWICPDQLNNSYQGYWPVIYKASDILKSVSWACILQIVGPDPNNPWQKPIPSATPATWPSGFNCQNFGQSTTPPPQPTPTPPPPATGGTNYMLQAAQNEWNSTGLNLPTSGKMWDQWYNDYKSKKFHGPPTLQYKNIDWNNNPITVVNFPGWGKFETTDSGVVNFYPYV